LANGALVERYYSRMCLTREHTCAAHAHTHTHAYKHTHARTPRAHAPRTQTARTAIMMADGVLGLLILTTFGLFPPSRASDGRRSHAHTHAHRAHTCTPHARVLRSSEVSAGMDYLHQLGSSTRTSKGQCFLYRLASEFI
jgi:hypothetical protein